MDFPLYFYEVIWVGGRGVNFFLPTFFPLKAENPQICPCIGGNVSET